MVIINERYYSSSLRFYLYAMSQDPESSSPVQNERKNRITPAMQQFYSAKEQYPDCVIFFRMGDFYETFCEDAEICARELDITLTSRGRMPDGQDIPLAGVPYHAVDNYLSKMISKGYKVAICEQVEDPKKAKGIVKREVIRVVTPGTVIDAALIPGENARYLMSLWMDRKKRLIGLSFLDISTADFQISEIPYQETFEALRSEIARFHPAECIIPEGTGEELSDFLTLLVPLVSKGSPDIFNERDAAEKLCNQFGGNTLDTITALHIPLAVVAAAAALRYAQ